VASTRLTSAIPGSFCAAIASQLIAQVPIARVSRIGETFGAKRGSAPIAGQIDHFGTPNLLVAQLGFADYHAPQ
jgi:hypothetical protein